MASNPSSRLNGIFQDATASGGGNDALRYTAPREPPAKAVQPAQPPAATPTPSTASTVVYSTMVSLYQYDASVRKYIQLGGTTTGTKAAVGCVIVGAETTYNLLFYDAAKHHLCALALKFGSFKPTLQAKNYVNFYDDQNGNWSIKFASDAQVAEFMRQVFLTKIHVEIWGRDTSGTKVYPTALLQDDLTYVKPGTPAVGTGDTVAVAFRAWRVVGNATSAPADIITKYAPFEQASGNELRKVRLGDASERIKALEDAIHGMSKGGKRLVLAPPGKTNGQDWYLLDIELVKTKTGASVPRKAAEASEDGDAKVRRRPSRRPSDPAARTPGPRQGTERLDPTHDLVPYDEQTTRSELEMKEVRLLQREQQLELHARALERERLSGPRPFGTGSSLYVHEATSGSFHPPLPRPVETMLSELTAKVDYLIRMAPGPSSVGAGGAPGPSDVAAVIRGVERLAAENERLLTQINAQHQHQAACEKRCEDLLVQHQRLQQEKRTAEERYQSAASMQATATSEMSALASARDAAVGQTNRLHQDYQQLLTAYYQLQQQAQTGDEGAAQAQALAIERDARARAEKQLEKEGQARALALQEVALMKKQHDVALQVKASEWANATAQLEQEVRALKAHVRELEDANRRLEVEATEHAKLVEAQAATRPVLAQLQHEKLALTSELQASLARVRELETAAASVPTVEARTAPVAADETGLLLDEMARLQQQVAELERAKADLEHGARRANACEDVEALEEREAAADGALKAAEAIKREAQELVASAALVGDDERGRLVALVKEAVNDMFFRFQDLFEEETALDGTQVLGALRKVLKTSTKRMVQQLQEPLRQREEEKDVREEDEAKDAEPAEGLNKVSDSVADPFGEEDPSGTGVDATQKVAVSRDEEE